LRFLMNLRLLIKKKECSEQKQKMSFGSLKHCNIS
jgi:hypothetical protein